MSRRLVMRGTVAAGLALLAIVGAGPPPAVAGSCSVPLFAYRAGTIVFSEAGRVTRIRVEVADTPDRQEVGLMCRNSLDPDAGMLFVFPASVREAFWMKNTLIPLAIAFIDVNWRIIGIMEMPVAPDPTAEDPSKFPLFEPHRPYRYAVEVNAGFFKGHEITERAEVHYIPP